MSDPPEKVGELKTEETKEDKAEAAVAEAVQHVVQEVCGPVDEPPPTCPKVAPKKRRLCRYPGCTKVIKSQGHCQRHGARAKRCKVAGCDKQAQGTHDGMCKRHWKQVHFPAPPVKPEDQPPPPEGESIYDKILPSSISYRPSSKKAKTDDSMDDGTPPDGVTIMPLITFLREGAEKEPGWHRNSERRARGLFPVTSSSSQLEPWERQLALVEILLLSGGTPYANFKDLAHGWGREKGFHNLLVSAICERRGEVDRKRRSDARTPEALRDRRKKTRIVESASPPVVVTAAPVTPAVELKPASVDEMVTGAAVEAVVAEAAVEAVVTEADDVASEMKTDEAGTVSV